MNNIVEKLGLYDLLSIYLTGTIIMILTVWGFNLYYYENIMEVLNSIYSIPICYLIGIIFNEIGNRLYNYICFKKGKNILLEEIFEVKEKKYDMSSLTKYEIDELKKYLIRKNKEQIFENKDLLYNYCKNKCKKNNSNSDLTIGSMARSFSIFFFAYSIGLIIYIIKNSCNQEINKWLMFGIVIVSVILSIKFKNRYIRFTKKRYVLIIRKFIYKEVI